MDRSIRAATPEDAPRLLEIYRPIVEETAISFELSPPSVESFAAKISAIVTSHAWLVLEENADILGYAYASLHRERAAYRHAVETSVYVHPAHYGKGVGRQVYEALFQALDPEQFHNAYAGISLPNDGSIALHKMMGFTPIGVFREIGYKFGRWHDVSWWQRGIKR